MWSVPSLPPIKYPKSRTPALVELGIEHFTVQRLYLPLFFLQIILNVPLDKLKNQLTNNGMGGFWLTSCGELVLATNHLAILG